MVPKLPIEFERKWLNFRGKFRKACRLVREVLYGMQSRGSLRLSEIARSLEEETSMKKIIERLSRQLNRRRLRKRVRENLLDLGARCLGEDTLLLIDPTDISKPYARKMEYLARVKDGSEGGIRDGDWCCQVVAARRNSAEVLPLYQELYSQKAPDFESENEEILKAIEQVSIGTGGQGTWVMDRGGGSERDHSSVVTLAVSFFDSFTRRSPSGGAAESEAGGRDSGPLPATLSGDGHQREPRRRKGLSLRFRSLPGDDQCLVYLEKSIKLKILVQHIHRAARIRTPVIDPSADHSPLLPLTL